MSLKQKIIGVLFAILALLGSGYTGAKLGSVTEGYADYATSTKQVAGTALNTYTTLKTGGGVLTTVNVLGATAGQVINFYDATTTTATSRTKVATSSVFMLQIPSVALGASYSFNLPFNDGLIMEIFGATGTSTISWR